MDFNNQKSALQSLKQWENSDVHSMLISGSSGCGKTYLANQFAVMKHISDFVIIQPSVSDIKDTVDSCSILQSDVVLCIENLDLGVSAASYALLKFLEEPSQNVYIIITCRNVKQIPDTIISRTVNIDIPQMTSADLFEYAKSKDSTKADALKNDHILWSCVKSSRDIDSIFNLDSQKLEYISGLESMLFSNDTVSAILWKFQKFPDSTPVPTEIALRYIMTSNPDRRIFKVCYDCLSDIACGRIATHAAIAKFIFQVKYAL